MTSITNIQLGRRWPNGRVRYAISDNIPDTDARRTAIENAIAHFEERTPLRFREIENPCAAGTVGCGTDYVLFQSWPGVGGQSATPTGAGTVGMLGGQQLINLAPGFGFGGTVHEIGHAIGMFHEHTRPDRDEFVQYTSACVSSGRSENFTKRSGNTDFGPYDFASIMHYSSTNWIVTNPSAPPCSARLPLRRIAGACPGGICRDRDGDGFAEQIFAQRNRLSEGDINAAWAMYGNNGSVDEDGDRFGSALAAADFDQDGYLDLAVGAPREDQASTRDAGMVQVYKGGPDGFQPWRTLWQSDLNSTNDEGALFGSALATGDFDDDGFPDLAVGTPGKSIGEPRSGGVFLLRGGETGLERWRLLLHNDVLAQRGSNDQLGYALAVGDFNGDLIDDLAIGAPFDAVGDGPTAGTVYVMTGSRTSDGLNRWRSVRQDRSDVVGTGSGPLGTPENSDRFGISLAAGRINSDRYDDLVVGASCDSDDALCAGSVYVFQGSALDLRGWQRLNQTGMGANEPFDSFGAAVAVGDLDNDGRGDVIVGTPYEDLGSGDNVRTNAGLIHLFRSPSGDRLERWMSRSQSKSDTAAGDWFGQSLAFMDRGFNNGLIVGAPGERWGSNGAGNAGVADRFLGSDTRPNALDVVRQRSLDAEEANDQFGRAVLYTSPTDESPGFVVVSATGEDQGAGAVYVFEVSPISQAVSAFQKLTQETEGSRN